jgi:cyanate lyase
VTRQWLARVETENSSPADERETRFRSAWPREEEHMTKKEMSEAVLSAKKAKGLTWAKLAEQVGLGEVWLASCGHGENCLDPESADRLAGVLGLGADVRAALVEPPLKGWSMENRSRPIR